MFTQGNGVIHQVAVTTQWFRKAANKSKLKLKILQNHLVCEHVYLSHFMFCFHRGPPSGESCMRNNKSSYHFHD